MKWDLSLPEQVGCAQEMGSGIVRLEEEKRNLN